MIYRIEDGLKSKKKTSSDFTTEIRDLIGPYGLDGDLMPVSVLCLTYNCLVWSGDLSGQ